MNASIVKKVSFRIVGCVRIVTISFSAKPATTKGMNSKVYTQIHIKNIMFSPNFSDMYCI